MQHFMTFQQENSLEKRKQESLRLRTKYPDRVPVLIDRCHQQDPVLQEDKFRFLFPLDFCASQVQHLIRRRLSPLNANEQLFYFVGDPSSKTWHIVSGSLPLSDVYRQFRTPDGFLYFCYSRHETFGGGFPFDLKPQHQMKAPGLLPLVKVRIPSLSRSFSWSVENKPCVFVEPF